MLSLRYIGLPLKTISSSFRIISFTEISYSSIKMINSSDDKFLLLRSIWARTVSKIAAISEFSFCKIPIKCNNFLLALYKVKDG